ncbi:TetR family transcriptional regulator [Paenibacillus sp. 32O-W]|jgi:Transcriptional regulator|uniref:TetR family transcriptional regulator n=1 Tax=Paenibacillus cisolokensis TaxID=1658519 RepID=A0ABQ4NCQ6_9BACL|nr:MULTISPECIES: TetR/AcrR family transcriptional regulator [Paenibacillus]ALS26363.1 TetR family transcriptional regulator [Paenibacillus sp. 32O-W]GIQ66008.1 TetR family transcriptional regulator [Paenibacillus cisolokensis]
MARKTPEEAERTRQQIMKSAKELFIRKGYGASSMEDICEEAGVSKGSIYYHFKSKEQLFLRLLEQNMLEWEDKWRELVKPGMTATEKLYALAEHYAQDFDNPLIKAGEEFAGSYGSDPAVLERLLDISRRHYPLIGEVVEEGIEKGEFRHDDPKALTYILVGMMSGLGLTYYENMPKEEVLALHRKAIDIFVQGAGLPRKG